MRCRVEFPPKWINADDFETALRKSGGPHGHTTYEVIFHVPIKCKVMVDAAVRLLSLANQLHRSMRTVRIEFAEGEVGTMGYLNRVGFFDHLAGGVIVTPHRPAVSAAQLFRGTNAGLVEIAEINPSKRDKTLPTRLTDALVRACAGRSDIRSLENAAWTVFAELTANIFDHSATLLGGYAALQLYSNGRSLKVAVSDSGLGIIDTLRPALVTENPALNKLSDVDLLVEVFRQGISRHGKDRGCGLKGSADQALKYNAELDVRLRDSRVRLIPSRDGYQPNMAYCYSSLPLLWGTHICFNFRLDGAS